MGSEGLENDSANFFINESLCNHLHLVTTFYLFNKSRASGAVARRLGRQEAMLPRGQAAKRPGSQEAKQPRGQAAKRPAALADRRP